MVERCCEVTGVLLRLRVGIGLRWRESELSSVVERFAMEEVALTRASRGRGCGASTL